MRTRAGAGDLYVQKAETASVKEDITAAGELGTQGVALLEKVLPAWAYESEFGGKAAYGELMNAIGESANDIIVQARSRSSRRKTQASDES